jgi:hypothetical protein
VEQWNFSWVIKYFHSMEIYSFLFILIHVKIFYI